MNSSKWSAQRSKIMHTLEKRRSKQGNYRKKNQKANEYVYSRHHFDKDEKLFLLLLTNLIDLKPPTTQIHKNPFSKVISTFSM